jgi:hypothetical protein
MKAKFNYLAFLAISATFLNGCGFIQTLNGLSREQLNIENQSIQFSYIDNQILIDTEFPHGSKRLFLLDLGSPVNVVFKDSSLVNMEGVVNNNKFSRRSGSADGNHMKREFIKWGNLRTSSFELENSFLSTFERPDPYACNKISGIWGASLFTDHSKGKNNKILIINMQDSTAAFLDTLPSLENWILIESNFTYMSHIKLYASIGEKKTSFYFDTGFSGSIIMSSDTYNATFMGNENFKDEKKIYGYITNSLSGTQIDSANQCSFSLNLSKDLTVDSVAVLSTKSIDLNALGMEFIRRFNVLVDYKKKQLYLQPNPNYRPPKMTFFISKGFKARVMNDNKILIINMDLNGLAEQAGLKIGDQILSINNIETDTGDNCEVVRLFAEIDGKPTGNKVTIKRNNEILNFEL